MANAEEPPFLQFEPLKAAKKRCKGVTRNGAAWAMQGGPSLGVQSLGYVETVLGARCESEDSGHTYPLPLFSHLGH